jgi:hypothetical protein
MKQELNLNSTEFEQLRATFKELLHSIPLSKRKALSPEVKATLQLVKLDENLLTSDFRTVNWGPDGVARKTTNAKKMYKVSWRGGGEMFCNIEEAAKEVRMRPSSLRTYLAKGQGFWQVLLDFDTIVSVVRVDAEGNELRTFHKPNQVERDPRAY